MKVLLLVALAAACSASPEGWESFKSEYNKTYSEAEDRVRYMYYSRNAKIIDEHNAKEASYKMKMNMFGDLSDNEFVTFYLGVPPEETLERRSGGMVHTPSKGLFVPSEVDWVTQGYVTGIKNQGACGSCWAFSTTGSLEGQHFKKTKTLVSLSEQNLVDCSSKEGNKGCSGGLMDNAFKYIEMNGGIDTEQSYPYTARTGTVCKFRQADVGATCSGFVDVVPRRSEEALQSAVAEVGPVSVAIDASSANFRFYHSGVFNYRLCSSTRLDHGVLAVGYGAMEGSEDYWLVKNSWGTSWGAKGYIKMSRNKENQCGIATMASYPKV